MWQRLQRLTPDIDAEAEAPGSEASFVARSLGVQVEKVALGTMSKLLDPTGLSVPFHRTAGTLTALAMRSRPLDSLPSAWFATNLLRLA